MRGRTLNDSFIILDEAQNTSPEQMQMFLTRLGFGSKVVVTGDVTQIDLPREQASGLIQVQDILGAIDGIAFVRFGHEDVVRHKLVQRIVEAYQAHTRGDGHRARARARGRGRGRRTAAASRSTRRRPSSSRASVLAGEGVDDGELGHRVRRRRTRSAR